MVLRDSIQADSSGGEPPLVASGALATGTRRRDARLLARLATLLVVQTRVALLVSLTLVSGCGAPGPFVVQDPPLLALGRDHYVLPPRSAPVAHPSAEAQRRLEAEWPPVDALSLPSPPPPDGPVSVRPQPRLGRPRPLITPATPARAPVTVHGVPHVDGVILRAAPEPAGSGRVVLILETR